MHPDGTGNHRLGAQLDRDIYVPQWAADSQGLYAEYPDHGTSRLGRFGLDGTVKECASGINAGFSFSLKGEIAYAGDTPTQPNELKLQ